MWKSILNWRTVIVIISATVFLGCTGYFSNEPDANPVGQTDDESDDESDDETHPDEG